MTSPPASHQATPARSAGAPRGLLCVLAGPSGVGKTTVCQRLIARHPDAYIASISRTTRPARPGETDGVDYDFCAPDEFARAREAGELLESNEYCGHAYGTPRAPIEAALARAQVVLLDIDVNGAAQVRASGLPSLQVFLAPPSPDALLFRIAARADGMPPAERERRLERARHELAQAPAFDHVIVNDRLDQAVNAVDALIEAARQASS